MTRLLSVCMAACVAAGLVAGAGGCGNRTRTLVSQQSRPDAPEDRLEDQTELRRDLETTVLENYLQLTVGNMEAYADGIARDREITILGTGPGDAVTGTGAAASCAGGPGGGRLCKITDDRLPLRSDIQCGADSLCPTVYSKNLELHLSQDGSVAWILDELSYRLPHQGREAAVPLRFTAVLVRDADRWLMVMEHLSYPLPTEVIQELAATGALVSPSALPPQQESEVRARLLVRHVLRRLTANAEAMRYLARMAAEKSERLGRAWVYEQRALLWPDPRQEFQDTAFYEAPSLADVFGGMRITIPAGEVRLFLSESGSVAWLAFNVRATRTGGKDPVTIGMRATAVFELDVDDWNLMQLHVSVPITPEQLEMRVLGAGLGVR